MGGESKWRKLKLALRLNTCIDVFKTSDDDESLPRKVTTPTPSSSGLQVSKSGIISSSEQICAICLMSMKTTNSHAIFTAECSHSFHFHCITSNVKHGNRACPVCRAKWKKIPLKNPGSCVNSSSSSNPWSEGGIPPQQLHADSNEYLFSQVVEPPVFDDDDDELVVPKEEDILSSDSDSNEEIEMKTYLEVSEIARLTFFDNFGILINIKAPVIKRNIKNRASIDLVTVLDISGSMEGTKIVLLKQAMCFLVQHLGPCDRLSVIVFSSKARRLFPLCRMTESGKQESLQMINSLVADGLTNIAEALIKGAKVMTDRKFKNPVSSMILLSDGQDPYYTSARLQDPGFFSSIQVKKGETRIPIHTFGFGVDHDARSLHFIAEHSGGMFSFIEDENVIQDAFAQCIGGLLSVVVQDLRVEVECVDPVLHLGSIKGGSYKTGMDDNRRSGYIEVGDLCAEEQRDFLVEMDIPVEKLGNETSLVKFRVIYTDPIKKTMVMRGGNEYVMISRPEKILGEQKVSIEVDRQKNRLRAAEAIAEAQTMAESGNLTSAVSLLEDCVKKMADSVSGCGGDLLIVGLMAELKQMKVRMVNRSTYENLGRAYVLSGLSSHSWQRPTTRGDSTEVTTEIHSYQTQRMVDMINISHTMSFNINGNLIATPSNNQKSA